MDAMYAGKKAYVTPELIEHGSIESITGWVGGPWGEFFGGQGGGWNPWKNTGGSGGKSGTTGS